MHSIRKSLGKSSTIDSCRSLSNYTCNNEAVRPKKVFAPVASTSASTSPRATVDPILQDSPLNTVMGMDSPVREDWSISTEPSHTLQSAGTYKIA